MNETINKTIGSQLDPAEKILLIFLINNDITCFNPSFKVMTESAQKRTVKKLVAKGFLIKDGKFYSFNRPMLNELLDMPFEEMNIKLTEKFVPPTIEEIETEFAKHIDKSLSQKKAEEFYYYYSAREWKINKQKMKQWRMAVALWVSRMPYGVRKNVNFEKVLGW